MPDSQPALRYYLHVLRRQWWTVALLIGLALGAAAVVTFSQEPVYRASMKIVVGQSGGLVSPEFGSTVEPFTQTMLNLLESDIVATTVINRLALGVDAKKFLENVHASSRAESSVLEVSYESPSKQRAVRVLSEIGTVFTALVDERLGRGTGSSRPITASVFDPAHLEPDPVSPKPVKNFAFAGALGLALGLVFAFLREALDDRIRTRKDAEHSFGAPVIGSLPKGVRGKPPFGIVGQPAPDKPDLVQALHLLRANLLFSQAGAAGPTIAVTSALPEEGKSTVAASLSVMLALAGHDVICVDADMRAPSLQRFLGVRSPRGLADVLAGRSRAEVVLEEVPLAARSSNEKVGDLRLESASAPAAEGATRATRPGRAGSRGRLRVMLAGNAPADPSEVWTSDRVEQVVDSLRSSADYVIFDTPPILLVGDAFALVRLADNVIVVARKGKTTSGTAAAVQAVLEGLGMPKTSVVLTDSSSKAEYGYGYGFATAPTGKWPEGPPREPSDAKRRHEEPLVDLKLTEQALEAREAELKLARRKLREASEELADRIAALETRERELEARRQLRAEESERLRSQQATFGLREQALTEREQGLQRPPAELANRAQTADTDLLKQAKALDDERSTLEREQRRLEEARAEAEQRLVHLLEPVRAAAAQLEAQLAERQPEEEAKPSLWRRGRLARARPTVPPKGSAAG
jgi:Mrp family chromosome partitioning ATPase/capsular polysaccharide biosynthesis protein